MTGITRRDFMKGGAGVIGLSLVQLKVKWALAGEKPLAPAVDYAGFEAIYRKKWTWDKVVKGSHNNNCWYQRPCAWNVYVKDGIVWREEQSATYAQVDPRVPDFNPRGCQKGCSFSQRMYDGSRIHYPLKRIGERGEGKWKRVSWDEALSDIADKMIDAMISEDGPASMMMDLGSNAFGVEWAAGMRLRAMVDMPMTDNTSEVGDHQPGVFTVAGKGFCSSADDLFHADLIFIWGGNPLYTHIPNAHFITEARYNGAKIITIAPDFSPSSVHADQWVPVKIGCDAALGLSMAHVMIEEGIYKKRFVQEQSDLALLTHVSNGRFLRESDIKAGGGEEVFYCFDLRSGQVRTVSTRTLELGDVDPALDGEFEVDTLIGKVTVRPVFAALRLHLQQYQPALASPMCGVDPETIRGLARDLAGARAASAIMQSNFSKYYHGLEMERALMLCWTLAGQIGHRGAGYQSFPVFIPDGFEVLVGLPGDKRGVKHALESLHALIAPMLAAFKEEGLTQEMSLHKLAQYVNKAGDQVPTMLWLYEQAGLDKLYGQAQENDPYMKRPLSAYMEEALAKGWQYTQKAQTRVVIQFAGNLLRRVRGYDEVQKRLLPQLDLMVAHDFRMSNTAMQSDYVLPGAGYYEYDDFMFSTPLMPYLTVTTAAVKPVGESKSGFEFFYLLAKHIQARAAQRGLKEFTDRAGKKREFDVYEQMTFGGEITEQKREAMLDLLLALSSNVGGITQWKQIKDRGFMRFTAMGDNGASNISNATDIVPNQTMVAGTYHTEKKIPWPTLTRRLQFCIDHPFYEELGEVLPVHKAPPSFTGKHPIQLTGGHTRWSIHASYIDHHHLLRLQRGQPVVFVNASDAKTRGINDGDMVRVFNDRSSVEFQACVSAAARPGQAIVYHAWEAQQFKGRPYDSLFPSPLNPILLAGGYGHIQVRPSTFSPGGHDRGTFVDVARVGVAHPV